MEGCPSAGGLASGRGRAAAGEAPRRRTMVFCATRHSVELLRAVLEHAGVRVAAVHGAFLTQYV